MEHVLIQYEHLFLNYNIPDTHTANFAYIKINTSEGCYEI